MNAFVLMFQFQLIVPTADLYLSSLGVDATLSGLLIGLNQYGAAVLQVPVFAALRLLPFRSTLLALYACMILGNLLYAFALPTGSVAMLLIGRLLTASTSGLQISNTILDAELSGAAKYRAAVLAGGTYQAAAVVAYVSAAFVLLVTPEGAWVNAYSLPGYVSTVLCLVVFAYVLLRVPKSLSVPVAPEARTEEARSIGAFVLGLFYLFLLNYLEVVRQVTVFGLWRDRWQEDTTMDTLPAVSLFAGLLFLLMICTFPFDVGSVRLSFVLAATSYLAVFPYDVDATAGILLQVLGGVLFGWNVRAAFGFANSLALRYVRRSAHRRALIMTTSIAMNLGVAVGSTVSTRFERSVGPHLVGLALLVASLPALVLVTQPPATKPLQRTSWTSP